MDKPSIPVNNPGSLPKALSAGAGLESPRRRSKATLKKVGYLDIRPGPLMHVLEAPANDPDKVIRALEQSSALSARVLSVTNSAAIGLVGEIHDIRRAVIHMGAGRARAIAMTFGLQMMAEQSPIDQDTAHRLWVNSLEKAYMAHLVAIALDPEHADEAYALGLIQDIGLSALTAIDPGFYQWMALQPKLNKSWSRLEQEYFGIDHAGVGNYLLSQWNASPLFCEEVLNHHQPMLSQPHHSIANLSGLIAGMLPHDGEPMTQELSEWLTAVHGQFLTKDYPTPDDMIKTAIRAARDIHRGASSVKIKPQAIQRMHEEVACDTAGMVRQLCEIESLLNRKHEQLNVLQFEAITDPLTQLLNRRGFQRMAERRLGTSVERGLPVCTVEIDLDGFKQINDTHGHDAGDKVLIELARLLKENLDSSDLIGRLGGDEFAMFLINVDRSTAQRIIKRVTRACHESPVDLGEGRQAQIRLSVGAVTCEKPSSNALLVDMIAAADEAMYESKRKDSGTVTFSEYPSQKKAC